MNKCLGEELVVDKEFQKNSVRLSVDEMVTDEGDREKPTTCKIKRTPPPPSIQ